MSFRVSIYSSWTDWWQRSWILKFTWLVTGLQLWRKVFFGEHLFNIKRIMSNLNWTFSVKTEGVSMQGVEVTCDNFLPFTRETRHYQRWNFTQILCLVSWQTTLVRKWLKATRLGALRGCFFLRCKLVHLVPYWLVVWDFSWHSILNLLGLLSIKFLTNRQWKAFFFCLPCSENFL